MDLDVLWSWYIRSKEVVDGLPRKITPDGRHLPPDAEDEGEVRPGPGQVLAKPSTSESGAQSKPMPEGMVRDAGAPGQGPPDQQSQPQEQEQSQDRPQHPQRGKEK
jgi:hypothetical protein